MRKTNCFVKKIVAGILGTMLFGGTAGLFAQKSNLSVNGSIVIKSDTAEETVAERIKRIKLEQEAREKRNIVKSVEDIELPLRRIDYGEFRDDFNRRVADEIRKSAKEMYFAQERAKEITDLKDAVLPITKNNSYCRFTTGFSGGTNDYTVAFYDSLGRKISDDLAKEANLMYEKQQRKEDFSSWSCVSVREIWNCIWALVQFCIILMIIYFVAKAFYLKVIKK